MIVVDSTAWVDFLNGRESPHAERLPALLGTTAWSTATAAS
jgi:predicted nucleic acid-binding protein